MKKETYIQIGCYIAFVMLLVFSNMFSYDAGVNNGKIILCHSQNAYLINDYQGERCVDKSVYESAEDVKDEDLFKLDTLKSNNGEITQ